jgi:type III secretion system YscJ/HrcJ family lipoprotein
MPAARRGSGQHWPLTLLLCWLCSCSVPVAAGLKTRGIAAQKEKDPESEGHWRISVGQGEASTAVGVLAEEHLPPHASPGVLDALSQGSIVPSRLAEHAKLIAGTSGDLERSLRDLDGVVSVRVHLAVPPKDALDPEEQPAPPSASVLVRHRGSTPPIAQAEVQRLVAGAVPGLDADHVSVVMTMAKTSALKADRELSRFGPITVTRGSLSPLRLIVVAVVLLNLILIGALLLLWAKIKKAELVLIQAKDTEGQGSK